MRKRASITGARVGLDDGAYGIKQHPGYTGAFTRDQAPGAIGNGGRVMKKRSEPRDTTEDGTLGTVLGSIKHPGVMGGLICYFIEWDNRPRRAFACVAWKVEPVAA